MSWQLTSFGVVKYIVGTTYLACQLLFYLSIQSVFSFAPRTQEEDNRQVWQVLVDKGELTLFVDFVPKQTSETTKVVKILIKKSPENKQLGMTFDYDQSQKLKDIVPTILPTILQNLNLQELWRYQYRGADKGKAIAKLENPVVESN